MRDTFRLLEDASVASRDSWYQEEADLMGNFPAMQVWPRADMWVTGTSEFLGPLACLHSPVAWGRESRAAVGRMRLQHAELWAVGPVPLVQPWGTGNSTAVRTGLTGLSCSLGFGREETKRPTEGLRQYYFHEQSVYWSREASAPAYGSGFWNYKE